MKEERKFELKNHMSSVHDRLKVVCVWCEGKELSFRKAVDLKKHIKLNHRSVLREAPEDCFGEPNCFWLSRYPRDYLRLVKPTPRDSTEAKFLRRAVERWWPTVCGKSTRSMSDWRDGWNAMPLISPSPSPLLNYDERPPVSRLLIHELTISSHEIMALLYEEVQSMLIWHKVVLKSNIMSVQKERESLLRRLDQITPYHGVIPASFDNHLKGDRWVFARNRLVKKLQVSAEYVVKISKVEAAGYSSEDPCGTQEPAEKKRKTGHGHPVDVILPLMSSTDVSRPTVNRCLTNSASSDSAAVKCPKDQVTSTGTTCSKSTVPDSTPAPSSDGHATEKSPKDLEVSMETTCSPSTDPDSKPAPSSIDHAAEKCPKDLEASMKATCSKSTDPASTPAPSSSDYSAVKCLKDLKASAKSTSTDRASTSDPISTDNTTTSDPSSLDNHSTPPPTAKSLASTPKDSQAATPQATPQATPWRFTGPLLIPVSHEVPKMMDTDAGRSIDEAGDRHIPQYVPSETVPKASYPTYSPTPRTQPMQQVSSGALEMKAEALMKTGCMPLLAPARRSWEQEEAIVLPASSPVPKWPPKGWASYSADSKLLVWETVATALAIKDGLQLDRGEILDTF